MARLPALVPGDAGLASRILLLTPAWMILLVAVLTPTAALMPDQGDVVLYFRKAQALVSGEVPYRDFSFHYPPAAILTMAVPFIGGLLGPVDLAAYRVLFAGWQAALMVVLGIALARIAERGVVEDAPASDARTQAVGSGVRQVAGRLAVLAAGAALALTWRYDLFPALLVVGAVWAAIDRRPAWAGVLLGIGVLAKLYPIALLPAIAVPWLVPLDRRALVRLGLAFGLTVLAGLLPFVLLAGRLELGFFDYQVGHGIQIESLGGGLAVLVGLITGSPQPLSFANARVQVEGPLADAWLALVPALTIGAFGLLGWVGWQRARREVSGGAAAISPLTIVALAGASVMVLLVTSKVYSIQYVVWLLPFMAFLRGPRFVLAVAISALTIPIHPVLYDELIDQQALAVILVNVRNGLLLALTAWTLWDLARHQPPAPTAAA